jgi:hypothetical protein
MGPYDGGMEAVPVGADAEHIRAEGDLATADDPPATRRVRQSRPAWVAPALVGAGALGACVAVAAINPAEDGQPQVCPFKILTGLDCPGCGASRAANALLRGHLGLAVDHNLLFVVLLPVALVAYAVWALRSVGVPLPAIRLPKGWVPVLVVLIAAFWGLRLLPWEPFTWLASSPA